MKILFINETCGTGSHGNICVDLARQYEKEGHTCRIAYGRSSYVPDSAADLGVRIGNKVDVLFHVFLTRLFDRHGMGSRWATLRFLKWVEEYDPDMIWLHNIHGYFIHVETLFQWIKKHPTVKVKWTLHDCWAFTGHCAHYMALHCDKWKTECHHCPGKKQYPITYLCDNSRDNYRRKKAAFTGINDLSLIVPSEWLKKQVEDSFLSEYPIEVVNNRIDTSVFTVGSEPDKDREVYEKYHIDERKVILGVASKWTEKKGYFDFIRLAKRLDPSKYQIVMVGVDAKQKEEISKIGTGIPKTQNKKELAALYRLAYYYVNLTYEENYPTVNLEAEACGTNVITYDAGGSRETVKRTQSHVVDVGDLEAVACIIEN